MSVLAGCRTGAWFVVLAAGSLLWLVPVEGLAVTGPAISIERAVAAARTVKRKKKSKKVKEKTPTLVVLPFADEVGGTRLAEQVQIAVAAADPLVSRRVARDLKEQTFPFTAPIIKDVLASNGANALVRGVADRSDDALQLRLLVYAEDGEIHLAPVYELTGDQHALAQKIGRDLERALPKLKEKPVVSYSEPASSDASAQPAADATATPAATPAETLAKISTAAQYGAPAPTLEPLVEPEQSPAVAPAVAKPARRVPTFSLGADAQTLFWTYELATPSTASEQLWDLGAPLLGVAATTHFWPAEWFGADLRASYSMGSVDGKDAASVGGIDLSVASAWADLALRYYTDTGLGVGAHLAYSFTGSFGGEQPGRTIAPRFSTHALCLGADLHVTSLAPYFTAIVSGEIIPWGLYDEQPDAPGDPDHVAVRGWRASLVLRSTPLWGIFAEARAEMTRLDARYRGLGTRLAATGEALSDGRVGSNLGGLSLGLGWSYY